MSLLIPHDCEPSSLPLAGVGDYGVCARVCACAHVCWGKGMPVQLDRAVFLLIQLYIWAGPFCLLFVFFKFASSPAQSPT